MRKHNKPAERINRIIVALYEIKAATAKHNGILSNINLAFRRQQVAVMTKEILYDIMERDITPEYAEELIARDKEYRSRKAERLQRAVSAAETAPQSTNAAQVDDCTQEQGNAVERGIFDLDEQTCIDYLKGKGWRFAECYVATKWV